MILIHEILFYIFNYMAKRKSVRKSKRVQRSMSNKRNKRDKRSRINKRSKRNKRSTRNKKSKRKNRSVRYYERDPSLIFPGGAPVTITKDLILAGIEGQPYTIVGDIGYLGTQSRHRHKGETHACGAFGCVVQVKDVDGEIYGLKVMETSSEAQYEIKILQKLKTCSGETTSDFFIRMWEYGNFIFMIIPYYNNGDLYNFIIDGNYSVTDNVILDIVVSILRQLKHIHACGIVHHDLKPENIMLNRTDGTITAHIIDFGLSKEENTRVNHLDGSVMYIDPKWWAGLRRAGEPTNHFLDIWGIGCVLFNIFSRDNGIPWLPKMAFATKSKVGEKYREINLDTVLRKKFKEDMDRYFLEIRSPTKNNFALKYMVFEIRRMLLWEYGERPAIQEMINVVLATKKMNELALPDGWGIPRRKLPGLHDELGDEVDPLDSRRYDEYVNTFTRQIQNEVPTEPAEPLQKGWRWKKHDGKITYENTFTKETQSELPTEPAKPLPEGWKLNLRAEVEGRFGGGVIYYENTITKEKQSELPTEPAKPLPEGWITFSSVFSHKKNRFVTVYENTITKEKQSDRPTEDAKPLPKGWIPHVNESDGKMTYENTSTKEKQSERPTEPTAEYLVEKKQLIEENIDRLYELKNQKRLIRPNMDTEETLEYNEIIRSLDQCKNKESEDYQFFCKFMVEKFIQKELKKMGIIEGIIARPDEMGTAEKSVKTMLLHNDMIS